MRKLRLIKPWKLRAVKQRIHDNAIMLQNDYAVYMPCCEPAGNAVMRQSGNITVMDLIRVRTGEPYSGRKASKGPR